MSEPFSAVNREKIKEVPRSWQAESRGHASQCQDAAKRKYGHGEARKSKLLLPLLLPAALTRFIHGGVSERRPQRCSRQPLS